MLKTVGGLTQEELAAAFTEYNEGSLDSYLMEITSIIMSKKDDQVRRKGAKRVRV